MKRGNIPTGQMKWTDDRVAELEKLRILLNEIRAMDRGSGIVRRLVNCEQLAEELDRTDYLNGRESFGLFLQRLAVEERTDAAHGESKEGK